MTQVTHVKANDSVQAFINSLGSGRAASAHLLDVVNDVVEDKGGLDGRKLASLIASIQRKQDDNALRAVRSIIGSIFKGATIGKAKDKKTIIVKLSTASVDEDALKRFEEAVAGKLSLRANLAGKVKGETIASEPTLIEKAASFVKWAKKEELPEAALIAAIKAAYSA